MGKLPGRLKKTPLLTEDQKKTDAKFGRCPKGHALPHRTNKGNCTAMFCMGGGKAKSPSKAKKETALAVKDGLTDLAEADGEELAMVSSKIAQANTRHRARLQFTKTPESFVDEKTQEEWVEAKKKSLVPLALADVEYALKLGDAQEREKARKEVLDMTGHGRKEAGNAPTQPLIIITNGPGGLGQNPWVRQIDKDGKELPAKTQVIDAQK